MNGESNMSGTLKTILGAACLIVATQVAAQVTFYEGEGFRGRAFTTERPIGNFAQYGFNDRASSVIVDRGRWEICTDARFEGRCVVLRRGSYDSLVRMGINDRISSARPVSERGRYSNDGPVPLPVPTYEYRRRTNERVYEVPISSVRAVVGPPEQRCWIEREHVIEDRRDADVGGAIVGAIIGGVLGHQVGSGRGNDAATVGGAVAGALIGGNAARGGGIRYDRNVQRCRTITSARPEFWDVTYFFRGVEHHVQMSAPPGATILVNNRGEPRQ
jgi:uncharacterized protein YcfJ